MNALKYSVIFITLFGNLAFSQPLNDVKESTESIWKGTPMNAVVEEFKSECTQQTDSSACIKFKVLNLLEDVLQKDSFKVSEVVSVVLNEKDKKMNVKEHTSANTRSLSDGTFMDQVEEYIESHDLLVKVPQTFLKGTTFRISPRNLDHNELDMTVKLPEDETNVVSERGKKHKLKKILIPILVFVLLKAMTLIPLAIGILSLKAWNALQLSFISFLVSISLAIFQLCKKVAADSHHGGQISAHVPWESYPSHYASAAAAARNFLVEPDSEPLVDNSHQMAYRGYVQDGASS